MKWFKHMAASWDDERLAKLVGNGGMEGLALYGCYWRLLEIVASQIPSGGTSCGVRYPLTRWSLLLSLRGSLVMSTLSRLAVTGVVTVERDGSDVLVTIPNLLKYRDEYSRKSGHSPEKTALEGEAEGEAEKELEEEKDLSEPSAPHPEATLAGDGDEAHEPSKKVLTKHPDLEIYEAYPRKEGRRSALQAIDRAVKRITKGETERCPRDALMAKRFLYAMALAYARSPAGRNADVTKIPHPSTWFNQSRYLDDQANWQHVNGENHGTSSKIERIADSSRAALELLERMDTPAYLGGRGVEAGPTTRPFFEGSHGATLARNAG